MNEVTQFNVDFSDLQSHCICCSDYGNCHIDTDKFKCDDPNNRTRICNVFYCPAVTKTTVKGVVFKVGDTVEFLYDDIVMVGIAESCGPCIAIIRVDRDNRYTMPCEDVIKKLS